jgi:tetratricopeptide (TPR) repeat protein
MIKVFISYSHDSDEHAERVLALSNRLREDGLDCILDQYEPYPSEGWPKWMSKQLRECQLVLVVCTETYLNRVTGKEKPGTGKGVKWESTLAYNYIYNEDSKNTRFIPVVFSADDKAFIPDILSGATYHCLEDEDGYQQLYRRLTGQLKVVKPPIGTVKPLSPAQTPALFGTDRDKPPRLSLSRMPETMTPELLGRDKQIAALDEAWQDNHTRIVTLIAWGGVGKTCLLNHWLKKMAKAGYKGARRVYAWSFYTQGAQEGKQASADSFIVASLKWFGDPQPEEGPMVDRARRLAGLIGQENTLLVLDGMEPLQYPENKNDPGLDGRLKDPALKALLKELAHAASGLCLVSSRLRLTDLDDFAGKEDDPVEVMELEHLDQESGVKLLKLLGVTKGRDPDFRAAVQEHGGHALTLSLLGRLVKNAHDRDIRKRDRIKGVFKETMQGAHAFHVMESYESFLAGKPELEILRLMGLFDRPVSKAAMAALTAPPAIDTLTQGLQTMDDQERRLAISTLRDLGLLAPAREEEAEEGEALDCHPLVREYFGRKLEHDHPGSFRAAHERLYDFYRGLPEKEQPDTLEEMEPLFAAVAHGCRAGLHQRARDEVYRPRILRYNEAYTTKKLGAFAADLAALSNFFHTPWSRPAERLREEFKPTVLAGAAFDLRALGRLREAEEPLQAELEMRVKLEDWQNAGIAAGNLSELMLTLGRVAKAIEYGRQTVDHVDRNGDVFLKVAMLTTLADALHQAGRGDEATTLFREAEELQKKSRPDYPFLFSVRGYRYCDLLLGTAEPGKGREVMARAEESLKISIISKHPLSIGLDHLALGQAQVIAAQENNNQNHWNQARQSLDRAVEELRKSGYQYYLPLGLLAQAGYFRLRSEFEKARTDLEEVLDIARAGDMKLHLADYHLEAARLALAEKNEERKSRSEEELRIAEKMIKEMGYLRREGEVGEIRKRINCEL